MDTETRIDSIEFKQAEAELVLKIFSKTIDADSIQAFHTFIQNSEEFAGLEGYVNGYTADYIFKQAWYLFIGGRIDRTAFEVIGSKVTSSLGVNEELYTRITEYLIATHTARSQVEVVDRIRMLEECKGILQPEDSLNMRFLCERELLNLYLTSPSNYIEKIQDISTTIKDLIEEKKRLQHINLSVDIST